MVEINNQRGRSSINIATWSEGTDNYDVEKPEIMVMTSLANGERYLLITPITLANLSRQTQNSNPLWAPDATLLPLVLDALPQAAWPERLLSESQDAVALQQIKERGAPL